MPSPATILEGLTAAASRGRPVAIAWHVVLAAVVLAMASGRITTRRLAVVMIAAVVSVAAAAAATGNPFNAFAFGALAIVLAVSARKAPVARTARTPPLHAIAGSILVAFGWTYPHFVEAGVPLAFLYASPFGLIPCPTLSAVIGLTFLGGLVATKSWSLTLIVGGLFYGVFGVFRLGVTLDYGLIAGALALLAAVAHGPTRRF